MSNTALAEVLLVSDHQIADHHSPAFNVRLATGFRPDGFDVSVVGYFRSNRFEVESVFMLSHLDAYTMAPLERVGSCYLLPQDEAVEVTVLEQAIYKHWAVQR